VSNPYDDEVFQQAHERNYQKETRTRFYPAEEEDTERTPVPVTATNQTVPERAQGQSCLSSLEEIHRGKSIKVLLNDLNVANLERPETSLESQRFRTYKMTGDQRDKNIDKFSTINDWLKLGQLQCKDGFVNMLNKDGVVGLKRKNYFCYINPLLQCLLAINDLRYHYAKYRPAH